MMRSPGLRVAPGTSSAFPESLLMRTKLLLMVWFSFTSQNRQRWVSAFGSARPNLTEPYRQSPLSPLSLVLIQQYVQKPGKLAFVIAKSWLDFCLPYQRRISLPSQLKTRPVFRLTNSKSSTLEPTRSMQKSCASSLGLQGTPMSRDYSYFLGSVSLGLRAKSSALLMMAKTAPFLKVGLSCMDVMVLFWNLYIRQQYTGKKDPQGNNSITAKGDGCELPDNRQISDQFPPFLSLSTTLLTKFSFSFPLALQRFSMTSLLIFTVQLLPCDRPVNSPISSSSPRMVSPPKSKFNSYISLRPVSSPSFFTIRSPSRNLGKLSLRGSRREVGSRVQTKSLGSPSSINCRFQNLSFSRFISSMRRRLKRYVLAWISWKSLELGESSLSVAAGG